MRTHGQPQTFGKDASSTVPAGILLLASIAWMPAIAGCSPTAEQKVSATTLAGDRIDLPGAADKALALIFVAPDCPVSNRYVPEINRIYEEYRELGVAFFLVYTDGSFSSDDFAAHGRDFGLQPAALLDLGQKLRSWAGIEVTPEVALFGADGRLRYRGRIDNRFVTFGTFRPAATRHDLRLALDAVLAGKAVSEPRTEAIGCFIPPLEG